ncbi:hypothetical protein GHT06_014532 [Daphnia sinensis]|uniref:FHA domain-containing protein n=1 Tax=Daphnia sinensis TaxID=1820382 RepID=A0AAD5KR34_9CRUS|nr:hypothetical protein GHT06_014532 [Daphnia sinensis]
MADLSVKLPKPKYGQVVVLQKNGDEPRGHGFPLISTSCVVGRSTAADIRISSADVSLTHCIFKIDDTSGEASLEVHGNETQVNGTIVDPVNTIKLNHKDVVLIGGRKLRFEYLPPDYKPLPSKPISGVSSDSFNAEVVDIEENGDVVDSNAEKEEEVLPEVLSTPAAKRVSFGPYLSPEQFDNTLPPATPIKKGATPRRSTRYSGLKFTRPMIDPVVEEDVTVESPSKEQPAIHSKECIDETIISEDADASVSSLAPASETAIVDSSPSLGIGVEFPELSNPTNLEISVDAMSTLSDVSNIAAVPSECCSFLDEPIEEDEFGPEVVEQEEESLTQMEDTSLFSEDLIGVEIPVSSMTTSRLTNGTELLRSFTTSSLTENMVDEDEEEGITLSPEDMSAVKNGHGSIIDSTTVLEVETQETPVHVKTKEIPSSPQADHSDVGQVDHLVDTQKLIPVTPKADSACGEGVKQLSQTPKNQLLEANNSKLADAKVVETTAAVVVERVDQVDIININADIDKVMETPESSPSKASSQAASPVSETPPLKREKETDKTSKTQVPQTPKADDVISKAVDKLVETPKALPASPKLDSTNLEGVARLLETPKSTRSSATAIGRTPQADYTDVRGVKKLLQTPKPPPNTPKADYRDVRGVKRLLATPKAAPGTPVADYTDVEGVDLLMKTPKAEGALPQTDEEENKMEVSEVPEKKVEAEESKPEVPSEVPETNKEIKADEKDVKETPSEDKEVQPEKPACDVKESSSPDKTVEIQSKDKPVELEDKSEPKVEEDSATASKRDQKAAPTKPGDRNASGVKRVLRIPRVPGTPRADYSNVEGIDLLMKTPKSKEVLPQSGEEEKQKTVAEAAPEIVAMEATSETSSKSVESIQEIKEDAAQSDEKNAAPEVEKQETKETEGEKEAPLPRRGRRAAAPKAPTTPKADYRDVSGVKRLLKTPKPAPGTPKADYSDVEGVDLLMKTPKPKDPLPQKDKEEKDVDVSEGLTEKVVEESTPEAALQSVETNEEPVTVNADVASDVGESKATTEEQEKETKAEKDVTLPRRGRRAAAAKTPTTPKADYRDVSGVKRLLKTPKAGTPKADYSDVEGVDLLMKTPKPKDPVSETIEEKEAVPEAVPEKVDESPAESEQKESSETKEKLKTEDQSPQESTTVDAHVSPVQQPVEEETRVEKEVTPPRRGRRLAAAKTTTPKADYRDVSGVKRLLKTPKAAPGTPKADYSDVEGIDLLMKTPKVNDAEPVSDEIVVQEELTDIKEPTPGSSVEATEMTELKEKEDAVVAAQVEEPQPTQEEETEEVEAQKEVTAPRRGRRPAAVKINTPKADHKDVKGAKRALKTPTAAPSTPQNGSDVEDGNVLTPQSKVPEPEKAEEVNVPEGSPEKPAEEATPPAEVKEDEAKREKDAVEEPQSSAEEDPKEAEVEKEATPPRRGRRAAPKSNTPKPSGRAKRKPPSSDSEPESNGTADAPSASEKEEQVVEEKADKISTPKRSRRVPSTKVETPKAVRSTRGKRQSESDSAQSEEVESRPLRSKRRKEEQLSEKLTLSPVVRLQRIDVAPEGTPSTEKVAKVTRKSGSVSSGEEWGVAEEVKPVRRGRGRPPKAVVAHKTIEEEKAEATHKEKAVEVSISSDDDVEDVEVKSTKKTTTRRGAVKRTSAPEKEEIAPEGKRRRGETRAAKHVTGLDDVEMLHEGKGHAADIHANHVPDEVEANEESPVTSIKSGRSTRAKGALKVHFDVAETAPSPVRSTRSARKTRGATAAPAEKKVSVQLERDPDIETLAATAKEEEDKAPTTKRSRQKKVAPAPATTMADESPAVPATKRTRGGKKTTSEPELLKEDTSSPPPAPPSPRRTRRTRNN